ncbi:hypothetical protein LMG28614_05647 [Paraburkholderia ultramafica]|uniref:Uncharacterized protein n=1 Tax=Paraburkholderia ultramafica TaxID=1544867 RepID=A0A6S7BJK6_9BURK|nr:hypothetical protein LMG28614_05647 [Paraburkholderia ultramafica]
MIDGFGNAVLRENAVDGVGPMLAPCFKLRGVVPVTILVPKAGAGQVPHRQHDVSMMISVIAAAVGRMHREIRDHALRYEFLRHKRAHQVDALRVGQFMRQRQLDVAGELRVAAFFNALDGVPELYPIAHPFRRIVGSDDLGMQNAALLSVVPNFAETFILDARGGPVRSRGRRAAASGSGNDLGGKAIGSHAGQPTGGKCKAGSAVKKVAHPTRAGLVRVKGQERPLSKVQGRDSPCRHPIRAGLVRVEGQELPSSWMQGRDSPCPCAEAELLPRTLRSNV